MFQNYLTTALRNAGRHKLYTFINIAGLTVALTCAIFIMLFIADQFSYNRWIPDTQNLYRVESEFHFPGRRPERHAGVPGPVTPAMVADIPQVTAQTHLIPEDITAKVNGRLFDEAADVVDPDFFTLIRLPFIQGDPRTVFDTPNSVVISKATAEKFFGTVQVLGRTVLLAGRYAMTVTGVIKNLPHNTQLVADLVFPNTSKADAMIQMEQREWLDINGQAFVRLAPGADPAEVLKQAAHIIDDHVDGRKVLGLPIKGSKVLGLHMTPFTADHLDSVDIGGLKPTESRTELYGFGAIAVLIALIAGVNFTNLATARAMMRAREVSLRKVLGGRRSQLILQFLCESTVTALIALMLAFGLVELLTPAYDNLVGFPIALHYLTDWPLEVICLAVALATGLLGGLYPAFVLSSFRPATALQNNHSGYTGSALLRSALVVFQFAISIGLGITAAVVFAQVRHVSTVSLGFNRHNIAVIEGADRLTHQAQNDLAHMLARAPSIAGAALSGPVPFAGDVTTSEYRRSGDPLQIFMRSFDIARGFAQLYDMRLIAGRDLSRSHGNDVFRHISTQPYNVVVNVAAARKLGFSPQEAVGKTCRSGNHVLTIVRVLGNSRLDGVQTAITPVAFDYDPSSFERISVRINPGHVQQALSVIDRDWHQFAPNTAIRVKFLSGTFAKMVHADVQEGHVFAVFVIIAILVACLGLYGLAAFTAQRRTREIGIRKVFGARSYEIVRLLLWQFSVPVLLANVIA